MLPAPKHRYNRPQEPTEAEIDAESSSSTAVPSSTGKVIPSYLQRTNYLPLGLEDFGDGGAFPEIHVVQYPLNMGKPGVKSSALVAVNVDETGQVRYDSIVKQGTNRNRLVQSTYEDIKGKREGDADLLALPEEKEEAETAEKTRLALEALLNGKIGSTKPAGLVKPETEEPKYIRYAPDPTAPGYTEAAKQRVIRMVDAQVDPMEPPKHLLQKALRGTDKDVSLSHSHVSLTVTVTVYVLHSPYHSLLTHLSHLFSISLTFPLTLHLLPSFTLARTRNPP